MTITRRDLFGLATILGIAGAGSAPSEAEAALAIPDVRDKLWTSYYNGTRVWGYVDRHSVRPGDTFNLMLSVGPGGTSLIGRVEIFRVGFEHGGDRRLVATFKKVEVAREPLKITSAALGAGWPMGVDSIDTSGWPSGYYTIDFVDAADGHRDLNVAFIVVLPPTPKVDILIILSTNTFQAYNAWGGYSFYDSLFAEDWGQIVSFDRPTPPDFLEYEYFLVQWLEAVAARRGWTVGYATNFDIHCERELSQDCRILLSGCHNEYWSKEEFDHVYERIFVRGGNTIFFGANSAYWQVRYADLNQAPGGKNGGRHLVCYRSVDDPIGQSMLPNEAILLKTGMFREQFRRPETMLAGVAYQSYFSSSDARFPYFVTRADLPFFEGTGYQIGDRIGDVVGYEWDNRDPDGDGKRLWDSPKSQIPQLEANRIQVLFTGSPVDLNGKTGLAEAIYFTSPAGAKVFSTGTIRWAWGLSKPGFEQEKFRRFNENLFSDFIGD